MAALVDILLKAAEGCAAHALARHYWPFLWDGEQVRAPLFGDDRCKARCEAPREAVERWLRTHGRQLQWRLELASGNCILENDPHRTAGEFRVELRAYRDAHASIASHLRAFQAAPRDSNLRIKAEKALYRLYANEGQDAVSLVLGALHHIDSTAGDCERVACEVNKFLRDTPAQGRSGKNLAATKVAHLIAEYFDIASARIDPNDDGKTAEQLLVKLSRKPSKETRRDIPDDAISFIPNNPYCRAVEEALGALGVSQQQVGDNGWRSAVEAVCANR